MKKIHFFAAILMILPTADSVLATGELKDVKSLADLRTLPVIHLEEGWDVQVGMSDPGKDAGPWRLVYCLAKATKDHAQITHISGTFELGPVEVEVIETKAGTSTLDIKKSAILHTGDQEGQEALFCQAIPVEGSDDLVIQVHRNEKVLLERNLGKNDHRPLYWVPFVGHMKKDGDRETFTQKLVVDESHTPLCPSMSDFSLLKPWLAADKSSKAIAPEDAPLPGDGALSASWQEFFLPGSKGKDLLSLKLKKDAFVVTAAGKIIDSRPEEHFLARWWINDKPFEAGNPLQKQSLMNGLVQTTDGFSVDAGIPAFLGSLKVGDRVGLQLLYTPSFRGIGPKAMAMLKARAVGGISSPLLTNRLEITIDEHLLSLVRK